MVAKWVPLCSSIGCVSRDSSFEQSFVIVGTKWSMNMDNAVGKTTSILNNMVENESLLGCFLDRSFDVSQQRAARAVGNESLVT